MMRSRIKLITLCCGLAGGLSPSAGAAEPAAGIVIAVTGPTTPRMGAHAEIPADTGVKLGPGATLTFLHYERCKTVTVAGGTVMLTRTDFATDGRTVSEDATPCPKVLELRSGGGARLPVKPDFIFTGAHAAAVKEVTIAEDGRIQPAALRLDLTRGRAMLPAGTGLRAGMRYLLRVAFADRTPLAELVFTATPEASLVVLRAN